MLVLVVEVLMLGFDVGFDVGVVLVLVLVLMVLVVVLLVVVACWCWCCWCLCWFLIMQIPPGRYVRKSRVLHRSPPGETSLL